MQKGHPFHTIRSRHNTWCHSEHQYQVIERIWKWHSMPWYTKWNRICGINEILHTMSVKDMLVLLRMWEDKHTMCQWKEERVMWDGNREHTMSLNCWGPEAGDIDPPPSKRMRWASSEIMIWASLGEGGRPMRGKALTVTSTPISALYRSPWFEHSSVPPLARSLAR